MGNFVFGPKKPGHPSIGTPCPICGKPFAEGDYTVLIAIGARQPGELRKQRDGRAYNAEALEVHSDCTEKEETT